MGDSWQKKKFRETACIDFSSEDKFDPQITQLNWIIVLIHSYNIRLLLIREINCNLLPYKTIPRNPRNKVIIFYQLMTQLLKMQLKYILIEFGITFILNIIANTYSILFNSKRKSILLFFVIIFLIEYLSIIHQAEIYAVFIDWYQISLVWLPYIMSTSIVREKYPSAFSSAKHPLIIFLI